LKTLAKLPTSARKAVKIDEWNLFVVVNRANGASRPPSDGHRLTIDATRPSFEYVSGRFRSSLQRKVDRRSG